MRNHSGVFEVLTGVRDLDATVAYWRGFGYEPAEAGELPAGDARLLYRHDSAVTSVRLRHGSAQSGLIRLQRWQEPMGNGLGLPPMRATGCRWSVQRSDDLMTLWNHAEVEAARGSALQTEGPLLNARTTGIAATAKPFAQTFAASRNLQLFRPESQQVVMQRFDIDVEAYGTIATNALFRTTEVCHVAVVTRDASAPGFYDALGFTRGSERVVEYNSDSVATRIFPLMPGERLNEINFENPQSGSQPNEIRAGRLRVFLLESKRAEENHLDRSRPGHLGYGCYSCAVPDVGEAKELGAVGARDLTPVLANEFGEPSVSFTAPDGYVWNLVEKEP